MRADIERKFKECEEILELDQILQGCLQILRCVGVSAEFDTEFKKLKKILEFERLFQRSDTRVGGDVGVRASVQRN